MNPIPRPEAPHPPRTEILIGHFQRGPDYDNFRAHGTGDYLLIATLSGGGRYGFPGGPLTTRPGDLTLYAPQAPQDYATDPGAGHWELLWSHFRARPHWHGWLQWPEAAPGLGILHLETTPDHDAAWRGVLTALERAQQDAAGAGLRPADWAMHALEEALLRLDDLNPQRRHVELDSRVAAAADYLSRHLQAPLTLRALSRKIGLSPSRLSYLFTTQMGTAPMAFLESRRLDRAAQLLRLTTLNVEEAGREVGFSDPMYFSARFKKRFGQSPRDFRRRQD